MLPAGLALELVRLDGDAEGLLDQEAQVEQVDGLGPQVLHEVAGHRHLVGPRAGDLANQRQEFLEYFVSVMSSPVLHDVLDGFPSGRRRALGRIAHGHEARRLKPRRQVRE